ncbi:MAG: DEAD/DEAH box helicase, partial [Geodermatophilaceae bacterium]|nr:DEAD/DEAH box helicase [Geodermatophilaceae bacterium]
SALFASRFRECAARALLLPKRDPRRRTPLWQQRQRAAQLLGVASDYGSFPIVLEAVRECLQDVYDVPGLVALMRDVQARRVRLVDVETQQASPFAQSLLFGYVGAFLYEGDAPLAERRAQALALDTAVLAELLGRAELRELLDPEALQEVEAELQRLTPERRAKDVESTVDLFRLLGDLSTAEAVERGATEEWLAELHANRRLLQVRIAGGLRWIAIEDAGRVRDALGVALPVGVPEAFTEPVADPLGDLVGRFARTHGPFAVDECAARLGLGVAVVALTLQRLASSGRVVSGEFRPGGSGLEWCESDVLRRLRRRSLARLREEVEPVPTESLARFLPVWQQVGGTARGSDAVLAVVEQLAGAVLPASAVETLVLPSRVPGYTPAMLDELTSAGEVIWCGAGDLPGQDGWLSLAPADLAEMLLPTPPDEAVADPLQQSVLAALDGAQALFFRTLSAAVGSVDDATLVSALWDLVWAGRLTNDTLAPVRALLSSGKGAHSRRAAPARARYGRAGRIRLPARAGPPSVGGRWSLVPARSGDPTRRLHARAESLLERHGILTRGAVAAEDVPGGFAAAYRVLSAFEDSGRARRGYFVESLGAAQFATPGAVDRVRTYSRTEPTREARGAVVLAATDPANAYGAALGWPDRPAGDLAPSGHRPGRKAGALVVLVDGRLVLYVERGGRTLLSWSEDAADLEPAARALADAVRAGGLGRISVQRADGASVYAATPLSEALELAGFRPTPRGLRMRAGH